MKQGVWVVFLCLLVIVPWGVGAPLEDRAPAQVVVEPSGRASFVDVYASHKRACAIVSGDGRTYLGLYVFDRWGNCVARDDYTGSNAARDDLAVEWFPPDVGAYTVDVINFGRAPNKALIAIH